MTALSRFLEVFEGKLEAERTRLHGEAERSGAIWPDDAAEYKVRAQALDDVLGCLRETIETIVVAEIVAIVVAEEQER